MLATVESIVTWIAIWPFSNVVEIINLDWNGNINETKKDDAKKKKDDRLEILKYIWSRHWRLLFYILISWIAYITTYPLYFKHYYSKWICYLIIIIRDQLLTIIIYGGWHYFLYQSKYSLNNTLRHKKFNKKYPAQNEIGRHQIYTLFSTFISSLYEIFIVENWMDTKNLYDSFFGSPTNLKWSLYSLSWLIFINLWRHSHFYWTHRFILHPWFSDKKYAKYDIGRYVYNHIHILHHEAINPSPWSGLFMHPIETILYYSCMLIPIILYPQHPFHILFNKFHATISTCPGHDGFDYPGGGSYFHYLHHKYFHVNYGSLLIPFDKWFNTYYDGKTKRESINAH